MGPTARCTSAETGGTGLIEATDKLDGQRIVNQLLNVVSLWGFPQSEDFFLPIPVSGVHDNHNDAGLIYSQAAMVGLSRQFLHLGDKIQHQLARSLLNVEKSSSSLGEQLPMQTLVLEGRHLAIVFSPQEGVLPHRVPQAIAKTCTDDRLLVSTWASSEATDNDIQAEIFRPRLEFRGGVIRSEQVRLQRLLTNDFRAERNWQPSW